MIRENKEITTLLTQSISKNSLILTAFALLTAGVLAVTYQSTKTKIAAEERKAAQKRLVEIIPAEQHDNDLLADTWPIPHELLAELGLNVATDIHIARENNTPIAVIIPTITRDGYSGDIKMIVGINLDGSIAGVRALAHKETPGLGDKVDIKKSNWILSFNGKSLTNPNSDLWKVKKDGGVFDQFTGATITPRATVRQVKTALTFFAEHRQDILNEKITTEHALTEKNGEHVNMSNHHE